jgi:flagella basal body P-ring formation protein FlgA
VIQFKVQGSRFKVQESKKTMSSEQKILTSVILVILFCLPFSIFHLPSVVQAAEYSVVEVKIINFIKEIYNDSDDIQIRLNTIPNQMKEKVKVKNITFAKIPDANGDGICAVEINASAGRSKNIQVPFRVFIKRKLFMLKIALKKDDVVKKEDILIKETYMNGKRDEYPASIADLAGKIVKRDLSANTILTYQMLEEPVVVQRGEIVNIVAENKKLLVLVKGKTIDRGRIGDTVRVRNMSSGKEIVGRVTALNTVSIEF